MSKQFQITNAKILNFTSVNSGYWPKVKAHPEEPLIEAVINVMS
jgi:hypothetical protein